MGRKKIEQYQKKNKLSVTIYKENYDRFVGGGIKNKSKFIDELLKSYFKLNKNIWE